jgi:hypothetical protein
VKIEPIEPMLVIVDDVKVKIEADFLFDEPAPKVKKKSQVNRKRKKARRTSNDEQKVQLESKQMKTAKKQNFECTVCAKLL